MKNMNFKQSLLILKAHYIAAILTLLAVAAIGITITMMMPRQYVATTDLVFDLKAMDPALGQLLPILPGYIATQVAIIKSERVAQRVVKATRLDENPTIRADWVRKTEGKGRVEEWVAKLLLNKLSVAASRDTSIIHIGYTSVDPGFSVVIANAFAQAYLDANVELRVDPARQNAQWFEGQGKTLRENLVAAQTRLTQFQQRSGIVSQDENYDADTRKLNELSTQLTIAMGLSADARSKQRSGSDALPEVTRNSVVMGLRSDVARLEGKLQEEAVNLGRNHPQYQRIENELAALTRQLQVETQRVTRGFSSVGLVSRDNEAELRAAIAAQEKKLLQSKSLRNQLATLQQDVTAAQAASDTVTTRYNQSTLESQMTQANASVLSYASEPTAPPFSGLLKGIVLSLGAGLLLGVVLAFVLELLDRRVRCIDDLVDVIQLPVLSVIKRSPSRRGKLQFWRRKAALEIA